MKSSEPSSLFLMWWGRGKGVLCIPLHCKGSGRLDLSSETRGPHSSPEQALHIESFLKEDCILP